MEIKARGSGWVFETPQAQHGSLGLEAKTGRWAKMAWKAQVKGEQSLISRPTWGILESVHAVQIAAVGKTARGTSLGVQRLGLRALTIRPLRSVPGQGTVIPPQASQHVPKAKKKKKGGGERC